MPFMKDMILELPPAIASDVCHLGKVMIWPLYAFAIGTYHLCSTLAMLLLSQLHGSSPTMERGVDQQPSVFDLQCISWMLQTSLDKIVRLATLKHLAAMTTLAEFHPTLVNDCLNVFIGCISTGVNNDEVVVMQGLEELATVSALCFFSTISHLLVVDPTSSILEDVHQHYLKAIPVRATFSNHQIHHIMSAVHYSYYCDQGHRRLCWDYYKPSADEHAILACNLAKVAQFKYQMAQEGKVPRFVLRFVLHSLSLDPPPSTSVIVNCLLIIAIDLGCNMSDITFDR